MQKRISSDTMESSSSSSSSYQGSPASSSSRTMMSSNANSSRTRGGGGLRGPYRRPATLKKSESKYHLIASQNNNLRAIKEEQDELDHSADSEMSNIFEALPGRLEERDEIVELSKLEILTALIRNGGDATTTDFNRALDQLLANYDSSSSSFDPRLLVATEHHADCLRRIPASNPHHRRLKMEGTWITLSRPPNKDCLGLNENNDYMYTLDRLSFGANMFRPAKLVCSIQGIFHEINVVDGTDEESVRKVPKRLENDVRHGNVAVRSFKVITAFTVEPSKPRFGNNSPNKFITEPIEGTLTTHGYLLPYPKQNRFSAWFTGGSLQMNGEDSDKYHSIFNDKTTKRSSLAEKSKRLATKLLMGATANDEMDATGTIRYELKRPLTTYLDMLYMDETTRIMRSRNGEVHVLARIPPEQLRDHHNRTTASLPGRRGSHGPPQMPKRDHSPSRVASPPQRPSRKISPPSSPIASLSPRSPCAEVCLNFKNNKPSSALFLDESSSSSSSSGRCP